MKWGQIYCTLYSVQSEWGNYVQCMYKFQYMGQVSCKVMKDIIPINMLQIGFLRDSVTRIKPLSLGCVLQAELILQLTTCFPESQHLCPFYKQCPDTFTNIEAIAIKIHVILSVLMTVPAVRAFSRAGQWACVPEIPLHLALVRIFQTVSLLCALVQIKIQRIPGFASSPIASVFLLHIFLAPLSFAPPPPLVLDTPFESNSLDKL